MTEKEIKRLSRSDLIDIIYQLQKNEKNLIKMNKDLKARLASKEMKIENAGSIAEAALLVSGVFEKAQQAADIYLDELHRMNEDLEEYRKAKIMEAEAEAARIIDEAKASARVKIMMINNDIQRFLASHPELHLAFSSQEDNNAKQE